MSPATRNRRALWLVGAVILLAAGALLMSQGDEPEVQSTAPKVEFPRGLRGAEYQRMEARRTLPPAPVQQVAEAPQPEPQRRDPLLAALPSIPGRSAVVVEANAIRHSPVGELLVDCLLGGARGRDLEKVREELGIDPLEDIDRIATSGEVALISGYFKNARFEREGLESEVRGDARIYRKDHAEDDASVAVWRDEMVLIGKEDEVLAALDRLDGRAPAAEPAIDEASTYGEIYGVLAAEQLAEFLPPEAGELKARLVQAAQRVELHVDTRGDVAITADVAGPDGRAVDDLGRSFGAALSLARLKARAEGEDELVQFLDLAKVSPGGDRFALEVALPLSLIEAQLKDCPGRRAD